MMGLRIEHDLHRRRRGRNVGLGLVLAAFAALTFALTIAKLDTGGTISGFDYGVTAQTLPAR